VGFSIEYPVLSYRELAAFTALLSPRLLGSRIERVYVPNSPEHPEGFFKREWALDLYTATGESSVLEISLRPQAAGFLLHPTRTLRPGSESTRSGFDLSLHKYLTGGKISKLTSIEGDRVAILEVQNSGDRYELHLHLMPAKPFGALLLKLKTGDQLLSTTDQRTEYQTPNARLVSPEVEAKIPYRPERIESLEHYRKLWSAAKHKNALALRQAKLETVTTQELKTIDKKIESLKHQFNESETAPDWNYFGTLLQIHFYQKPEHLNGFFQLMDYERDLEIKIPADPKLGLKEQLEKFFHLAKRNKKRLLETAERIESLKAKRFSLNDKIQKIQSAQTLAEFIELEPKKVEGMKGKARAQIAEFSGKQYRSEEGLIILSGRNLAENLEATFKIARGNDLWFHVKGKPGSHTVVLLPPKRTASLETLLDAAEVCILHSGGKDWGKTEVDYTYRKFVKKIKNQTDVSYTHNKTLSVVPNQARLTRLFSDEQR
jgi:predicted ribosome quality control (RQC) complex YloA/Tae2 family protein